MKKTVYAIYDSKAKSFGNPFFETNDLVVLRNLKVSVNSDKKSLIYQCAEDYTLFKIAIFDDEKGTYENKSESICKLLEVKED